jgi:hypothetical protein
MKEICPLKIIDVNSVMKKPILPCLRNFISIKYISVSDVQKYNTTRGKGKTWKVYE